MLVAVSRLPWVGAVYSVGLMVSAFPGLAHVAVSPDGLLWIYVDGEWKLSSLEIKTRSGADSSARAWAIRRQLQDSFGTCHLILNMDDPRVSVFIPESEYRYQPEHQLLVLRLGLDYVVFVVAVEYQIMYSITCRKVASVQEQVHQDLQALDAYMDLGAIHSGLRDSPSRAPEPYAQEWRAAMPLWRLVRRTVAESGLLPPLKEIAHILQAAYSKNKGAWI